ncbi:MAG TPA: hemolysin family protein [Roseiflexaceae bacterium]|nr:hemolysin family protein [Roseiflexaceae bacterium]
MPTTMLSTVLVEIALILILILANGFFAASEIAIVSARRGRLEQQAEAGRQGARAALELSASPNRFLATVQVGITLISTFAAAFGGASIARVLASALEVYPAVAPYASSIALSLVVVAISYVSLILGELVPKRLALQNAEGIAGVVAPIMRLLSRIAAPVVGFLTFSTEMVLRLLRRHNVAEAPITEGDIMALVREGAAGGALEAAEENLIGNVFSFTDRLVRSLMTARTQIVAVAVDLPLAEVLRVVIDSGYSRIPVYRDTIDQVVGILYVKDLLQFWGQPELTTLHQHLRRPTYVLESQRAVVALQQLKQQHSSLAIVLDEFGQVAGLITIEDMLEEVVGEIHDEYDQIEQAVAQRDDGSYLVDGLLPFVDLQQQLGLPTLADEARARDFETVAGFVLALLGRIPSVGNRIVWHEYTFEVMDMDGRRIDKLLIVPPPSNAAARSTAVLASGALLPPPQADDQAARGDEGRGTQGDS